MNEIVHMHIVQILL